MIELVVRPVVVQHATRFCLVQQGVELGCRECGDRLEVGEQGPIPEEGGSRQEHPTLRTDLVEATPQLGVQPAGQWKEIPDRAHQLAIVDLHAPGFDEAAEHRAREQWVALRRRGHVREQRARRAGRAEIGEELVELDLVHPEHAHRPHRALAAQALDDRCNVLGWRPHRRHDEERSGRRCAREEGGRHELFEQPGRVAVGPVQIFDEEHDGSSPGDTHRGAARRDERCSQPVVRRRLDVSGTLRGRVEEADGGAEIVTEGGERVGQREVRDAETFATAPDEHERTATTGALEELGHEAGLADAGLTFDEHHSRTSVQRLVEASLEDRERRGPADQGLARWRQPHRSCPWLPHLGSRLIVTRGATVQRRRGRWIRCDLFVIGCPTRPSLPGAPGDQVLRSSSVARSRRARPTNRRRARCGAFSTR